MPRDGWPADRVHWRHVRRHPPPRRGRGRRPRAAADLLPLVYDELRKLAAARLAAERPGQTLQPTALVHEAYLRLVGGDQPQDWNGRGHFFAAAAEAMRRILVDQARRKRAAQARRRTADGSTSTSWPSRPPTTGPTTCWPWTRP